MSKAISLKIQDPLYREMEETAKRLRCPRNAYINNAIERLNRFYRRRRLAESLVRESKALGGESASVLAEFERLEDDLP